MQFSTIYLQVYYEYSKEELYLGLIGLTEAIPFIITSFFSGHIADKVHKKQILSIGILLLLFGAIFLFFNSTQKLLLFKDLGLTALFSINLMLRIAILQKYFYF